MISEPSQTNRSRGALVLGAIVLVGSTVGACKGGAFGGLAQACPALQGQVDPLTLNFSANARANAKIKTFVASAKDLQALSLQMEATAADSCARMGADLGLSTAQMAPRNEEPGARAQAACGALSARLDTVLRQGIQVRVQVQPPTCTANVDARAECEAVCNVDVDPGQIAASCEPARLSGFCQGRCTGRCDGRCTGDCQGNCSQVDGRGQCIGQCNGTCGGSCDATCHASCEGRWQAPKCEGVVQPPSADAECNASCGARANFRASCTPATVAVEVYPQNGMAQALAATLQANLPQLLHAELVLGRRILGDAQVVAQVGAALPKIVGQAGFEALACVGAAASASVQASARVNVSVRASASVSGKVGAT